MSPGTAYLGGSYLAGEQGGAPSTVSWPGVVVPAVPPQPPPLSLIASSVRPDNTSDPANPVFQVDGRQLSMLPADLEKELRAQQRDSWVRGISYAPENHYTGLIRDPWDFSTVDYPALPAPTGLTLTASAAAGTLAAATYSYQVTAVNANGETTSLGAVNITTAGTGQVILAWNKVESTDSNLAVTYKVYGRTAGAIGLLATVGPFAAGQAATFTDTGAGTAGVRPPASNTTAGPGSYSNLPIVNHQPFLVVTEDWCSSWGFEERDYKGRALRLLENAVPQAVEREFWTGALAIKSSYPNNYLINSAAPSFTDLTPAGGAPSIARGQQILQDYLATTGFGGQGMIHCQPQTAPSLLNARRVGGLLLDIFDNIIVPGTGYNGQCANVGTPSATTAVMFATDLVCTRAEAQGTVFPDTFAEALDWGQAGQPNTIRFRAMKFCAAYWDGFIQAGVRVNLAT